MGYYFRHSIFLLKPDMQKLKFIQDGFELLLEKRRNNGTLRKAALGY